MRGGALGEGFRDAQANCDSMMTIAALTDGANFNSILGEAAKDITVHSGRSRAFVVKMDRDLGKNEK
jgi:hypothetical protein